jgi:hypothetical protein
LCLTACISAPRDTVRYFTGFDINLDPLLARSGKLTELKIGDERGTNNIIRHVNTCLRKTWKFNVNG